MQLQFMDTLQARPVCAATACSLTRAHHDHTCCGGLGGRHDLVEEVGDLAFRGAHGQVPHIDLASWARGLLQAGPQQSAWTQGEMHEHEWLVRHV